MATTTVAAVLAQARSHLRVFDPAAIQQENYTVAQVMNSARSLLADVDVAGGEEFTDAVLQPHFESAYREIFIQHTAYLGTIIPATAPISGTVQVPNAARFLATRTAAHAMRSREGEVMLADRFDKIADKAIEDWIELYAFADNALVPLFQFAYRELYAEADRYGIPQVEKRVTVPLKAGDTEIDLVAAGLNDVAAPYRVEERLAGSAEMFSVMQPVDNIRGIPPGSSLNTYEYAEGKLKFEGATTSRDVRITYYASGTAPSSGVIAVDDALQFLAARTAALIAPSHESTKPLTDFLSRLADQALDTWISIKVRQQQSVNLRRPAFRTS